jgi:hypothetical protein
MHLIYFLKLLHKLIAQNFKNISTFLFLTCIIRTHVSKTQKKIQLLLLLRNYNLNLFLIIRDKSSINPSSISKNDKIIKFDVLIGVRTLIPP